MPIRRRVLTGLMTLCLMLCCLWTAGFAYAATTVMTGTVQVNDTLRVRSGAGTSHAVVGYLYGGDVVTIHETVKDSGGATWYKITKDKLSGYASADYIKVNATYETDEEFEAYLTTQGFPEDYKVKLRLIHAEYPDWVFRAEHLSMTWATAYKAESRVGLNTVQSPDAWKSVEDGAYNWSNSSYVVFDSGGWVSAAPPVIAYYMDPRNWLDSTYIFQFEDLSYASDQTVEGIKAILPEALDKHAEDLLKASKDTKVSAYFLATRMAQEGSHLNGLGTGTVAGYEGYYNFFSYGAYKTVVDGKEISAVQNGAIRAKNEGWDTPYKCMRDCAEDIGKYYIKLGQDTLYYQKYNVTNTTSGLYAHQYMSNVAAPSSEGRIRRNAATEEQLKTNLTFTIPVYKEMPATVAAKPSTTGNNHNTLNKLTVSGCSLTPSFSRYTTAYAATVGEDVTSVKITATPSHDTAKTSGTGTVALQPGINEIPIKVTASSGAVRTYTVTIIREGGSAVTPTVTGKNYTVSDKITGVEPGTTVTEFIKGLAVKDGTGAVYTATGKAKTSGIVATGDIVRLYSGATLCKSYPVVIYGDVNGDGKVSSTDLRVAQKHVLGIKKATGYYLTAADANKDGKVTSTDLRMTQKHILGITKTLQ